MPRHIMVCVSGFSGTGKDEFAGRLVSAAGAVQTGLADPAKRHMADVYGFTEKQLFGPSEFRNAGDMRYMKNFMRGLGARACREDEPTPGKNDGKWWQVLLRSEDSGGWSDNSVSGMVTARWKIMEWRHNTDPKMPPVLMQSTPDGMLFHFRAGDPRFWLSPREALQMYCEQLNNLWIDTWIHKGIEDQKRIAKGKYLYSRMGGVVNAGGDWTEGMERVVTCFADFRHVHEFRLARESASDSMRVVLVRIKRPSVPVPPYDHRSETEQVRVRDAAFDYVVRNGSSVEGLHQLADAIIAEASDPDWKPRQWTDDLVLAARRPEEGYAP